MNNLPLNTITADDQATYARDGIVCLRGMFDEGWIQTLRAAAEEVGRDKSKYEFTGPSDSDDFTSVIYLWRHDGVFRDYILNSPAAEIVGRVLGCEEIRAFQDHLFVKPIGSPHIMPWHHDMTTWPMSGHQVPTLWLALTPVDTTNGRLEFVRGYHKKLMDEDVIYRANYLKGDFGPEAAPVCPNFEEVRQDPEWADKIVGFDLSPGDLVLFHPRTPHGSGHAKNAKHPRMGLSSRWIGDDIRWKAREGAVPVPGMDSLPEGQRPDGPLFPVVWRRSADQDAA
ncbi:MAG: phytanoyl-CoA dioxygenase family protein [Pseudomonadota bacterium]